MVSEHKKSYMKAYNKQPAVKTKKADYMRRVRGEADVEAAKRLVNFLLEMGYEKMATDYALERAPEMLVSVKGRRAGKR